MHFATWQATNDRVSRASTPHLWFFRLPIGFPELRVAARDSLLR